ncbi:MAG: ATP-binding cassette domain-containing protein, partial [Alphaproteobacteria bacterium]
NLYNPQAGNIYIDGLEIRQLDPADLRAHLSYVPQNAMLFKGTLRENLLMANPHATDEQLLAAAEMSGVMDFARRHPMGFDMPIGEMGTGLSSGQKQAVGIARGILRAGDVVVLDDPTSEMDNRSEEWIKQNMAKWTQGKTMILITHRAPMLELVDRLIVMDYGRIIADGPKDDVLKALRSGQMKAAQA